MASKARKAVGSVVTTRILLLRPSTAPLEISPLARNQFITGYRPLKSDVAVGEVREYVTKAVLGLKESLAVDADTNDVTRARAAKAKYVGKLVLAAAIREGRPVYKVTGYLTLPDDSRKCRVKMVARDGLEPPTPAFSGPRSTN